MPQFFLESSNCVLLVPACLCKLFHFLDQRISAASHQVVASQVLFEVHLEILSLALPLHNLQVAIIHLLLHEFHLLSQLLDLVN